MKNAWRAGAAVVATAALALGGIAPAAMADEAQSGGRVVTSGGFAWKISEQIAEHMNTKTASGDATVDATSGVVTFAKGTGSIDVAAGTGSLQYSGTVKEAFVNGSTEYYSVTIANPKVDFLGDGKGALSATVSSASAQLGPSPAASTEPSVVKIADLTDVSVALDGTTFTIAATPAWDGVVEPGSQAATDLGLPAGQPYEGQSFAPEFLGALVSGVRAHFYASKDPQHATSGTANAAANEKKRPASLGLTASAAPGLTSVSLKMTSQTAGTLTVTGANFNPVTNGGDDGIYVGVAPAGGLPDVSSQTGMANFAGAAWVRAKEITDGAFTASVPLSLDDLDPKLAYSIYTWQAHTHSNTSQDTETALNLAPVITAQPTVVTTFVGEPAKLTFTDNGLADTFQWQAKAPEGDWADIEGGTAKFLQVQPTQDNFAATYRVVATGKFGSVTSEPFAIATVERPEAPTITDVSVVKESTSGITIAVAGRDFTPNTFPGDAGIYVAVGEAGGLPDVSSREAMAEFAGYTSVPEAGITGGKLAASVEVPFSGLDLTKSYSVYTWQAHTHSNDSQDTETPIDIMGSLTAVSFSEQPADQTILDGQSAEFSVQAAGSGELSYQWQNSTDGGANWTDISGATASVYATGKLATIASGQLFRVAVTGFLGTQTSDAAKLTVKDLPVPTITATASPGTYGKATKVSVSVKAGASNTTGTVTLKNGSVVLGTAGVINGSATLTIKATALKPGTHALTVSYSGNELVAGASASPKVTIAKAKATITAKLAKRSIKVKKKSTVNIAVKASGVSGISGKATVTWKGTKGAAKGKKFTKSVTVKNGKAKVTRKLAKKGTYKVSVAFKKTSLVSAATKSAGKLKVT
ncbi:hypothetical protein GCM10010407_14340 [Rarobacter incanus]